ncbi:MAG: beta-lactamase family protein [Acidimicrobiales bacterium]|nr:beta-lactamase family protein [Acidimicrobiales bacterium]
MEALRLVEQWPVPNVSAAVVHGPAGAMHTEYHGDPHHRYRLASISKPITAWAALVAVEEGIVTLDDPVGQPGCTLRHLLSHAGGYGFDGAEPITGVGRRRIYSNTGIELAAAHVADAAHMPFERYLAEAVFEPLGMDRTELSGSPAHGIWGTVADVVRFVHEVSAPRLVHPSTAAVATAPVFPGLRGVVPGVGSFDDCVWGLGFEIRGDKSPHWTGRRNSPQAFGHFGGAGTLLWVDPGAVHDRVVACVALTDRPFDEWADEALRVWPTFSDAVVDEVRSGGAQHTTPGAPR